VLLTLSTSMPEPADLGFLLHKHPGRAQSFDVATGTVHVVWPEVTDVRSTVAVLLEVDPVALVRGRSGAATPASRCRSTSTTARTRRRRCCRWRWARCSGPRWPGGATRGPRRAWLYGTTTPAMPGHPDWAVAPVASVAAEVAARTVADGGLSALQRR
jgi:hypothetical protein